MSRLAVNLQLNLQILMARVTALSRQVGRDVAILAVSKTQLAETVRAAWSAGQVRFAENYVQEALSKMTELADLPLEWHFIGPLQSNKTRAVAERFSWVQTVDREKIARRLAEARPATMPPLNVCVQVNISGEHTKSGVPPDEAEGLCRVVACLPKLRLRGLMVIGRPGLNLVAQRQQFRDMKVLFERINALGLAMDTLSMGMSEDMEAAIQEGATMVRVGTAIFGARPIKERQTETRL